MMLYSSVCVCEALVALSMDKFGMHGSAGASKQQEVVELPASYGRALPISEEEMSVINVSLQVHLLSM